MPYAMPTPQGIWVWDDPPPHAPGAPVVLAGVAGEADLAYWAARHRLPLPARRDHPDVPVLGLAQRGPVWLGTLPGGPWVAWTPEGTWALPATWPDWSTALAALREVGRPWHLWTPRSVWEARTAPVARTDPHQPWYPGQTPTGRIFVWQAGDPPRFVRAGSAPDAPPYEWAALPPAAQFVTGRGLALRGFCPRTIARRLTRTRAVSRVDLAL